MWALFVTHESDKSESKDNTSKGRLRDIWIGSIHKRKDEK